MVCCESPTRSQHRAMSRNYSASQYEQDYLPTRLGNWQVPAVEQKLGTAPSRHSTLQQPPKTTTMFMVDDRGHLKPGVKKINNSFRIKLGPTDSAPTRWPKPSVSIKAAPAATMGYKGFKSTTETGKWPVYDGVVLTRLPRRDATAAAAEFRAS